MNKEEIIKAIAAELFEIDGSDIAASPEWYEKQAEKILHLCAEYYGYLKKEK